MTVVDTSVWVEHFRRPDARLTELLEADEVLMHPFVFGELSLGSYPNRLQMLSQLGSLEPALPASDAEVLGLIGAFKLWGRGLGWVDCHLLASARAAHAHLATQDRALKAAWLQVRPK